MPWPKGIGRKPRIAVVQKIHRASQRRIPPVFREDAQALRELGYDVGELACLEEIDEINALHRDLISFEWPKPMLAGLTPIVISTVRPP